ncbi:MAG: CaiB/BaiF CoA-transferase family protein [Chloroflexota bacterium]
MAFALEGVKVIEMGPYNSANMAAQYLGDLGADVIVVEPPDVSRALGSEWSKSDRFKPQVNRNKRMIGLDLKQEEARAILHQLAKNADVLIESFRPGIAKKLGFDYDTLSAINPRLIVASMSGYGQKGPYAHMSFHTGAVEATGGWSLTHGNSLGNMGGDYIGKPFVPQLPIGELKAGPNFTIAIVTALYAREKTGTGQYIDFALLDGVITVRDPSVPARGVDVFDRDAPAQNNYECKDGKYICLAIPEPVQWRNLCEGLGMPELAKENLSRIKGPRANEIIETFQRIFKTRTRDEWFNHLNQWDTEVAKANTLDEARDDPQIKLREMHVEVVGKDGYREIQYGTPYKFSKTPARKVHTRAPKLGEDTPKILAELGFKQADITRLKKAGTVI